MKHTMSVQKPIAYIPNYRPQSHLNLKSFPLWRKGELEHWARRWNYAPVVRLCPMERASLLHPSSPSV